MSVIKFVVYCIAYGTEKDIDILFLNVFCFGMTAQLIMFVTDKYLWVIFEDVFCMCVMFTKCRVGHIFYPLYLHGNDSILNPDVILPPSSPSPPPPSFPIIKAMT